MQHREMLADRLQLLADAAEDLRVAAGQTRRMRGMRDMPLRDFEQDRLRELLARVAVLAEDALTSTEDEK